MTAEYVPFINSTTDCTIAKHFYSDAGVVRISLESIHKTGQNLPTGAKRWVDAGIDGLHYLHTKKLEDLSNGYQVHLSKFAKCEQIGSQQFQNKPDKNVVRQFVFNVLNACKAHTPDWVSIPQLPLMTDSTRNKINRLFAEMTGQWKSETGYTGKLILPVIFTHQNQLNQKTERNKKITSLLSCFAAAGADGVWAADSTLTDQDGSGTFDKRFPALRKFHEEMNAKLPEGVITICGPYWGMNLVLWTRNCVRFPAVALGGSYKYNIPGQMLQQAKDRLALTPLRRWAVVSPGLKTWLADTVSTLSAGDPARAEFASIEKDYSKLAANGRTQIANFYKTWINKFATLHEAGRALALYQDLSAAYVLGKGLGPLPKEEGTARRPERVAQQLMMNCL